MNSSLIFFFLDLEKIQIVSIVASFLSLMWNTMEWNWVGFELEHKCLQKGIKRLKLVPLYLVGSGYKCICIAIVVIYMRAKAIIPLCIIVAALVTTNHIVNLDHYKSKYSHWKSHCLRWRCEYLLRNIF